EHAGQLLLERLRQFNNDPQAVVVALPRGGVPVAYPIAKALHLPLDIVVPRKIGAPSNKEYAIGAIAENGEGYFNQDVIDQLGIPISYLDKEVEKQRVESKRRQVVYRRDRPPVDFKNKVIILVDDGIATGSTMKAAIESIKHLEPKKIVVAVPVAPHDSISELKHNPKVDEIICLSTPYPFNAVGNFYHLFDQTEDDTVIQMM
ncbi:hypothetical protein SAMD00019534_100270, partial [Acytostelium subglobosum LB1]|uniref:hypothetical protein n=1 Tax=Acytostelium subglobosum LB1 TaxID=1410327 RepID=UPI000644B414